MSRVLKVNNNETKNFVFIITISYVKLCITTSTAIYSLLFISQLTNVSISALATPKCFTMKYIPILPTSIFPQGIIMDDGWDQLNRRFMPILLLIMAVVVSLRNFTGSVIKCNGFDKFNDSFAEVIYIIDDYT